MSTYSFSKVNTNCIGRRLGPPTQEPRHMNWYKFTTHSEPAANRKKIKLKY